MITDEDGLVLDVHVVAVCPRCGAALHVTKHPKGQIFSCWNCPYSYTDSPGYESPVERPRIVHV